jgi:hypothetical protein
MKKEWYDIYMECIKESPTVTTKLGEVIHIGRIKSEGLAYVACKAMQESVKVNFKVYYK